MGGCLSYSFCSMVELSWSVPETTQEHLQNLVSQGYMTAVELATCHVPVGPTSHVPVGGYIVVCPVFYKQGFGTSSHQFLRLLLQFYSLELHHLTPSRILHITASVTPCEAFMRIEPHFHLWNYFFHDRLRPGSNAEVAMCGCVDIYV
jgi:hypothetical protein